jgi:subtilisin family serine protease/tetratricopeptide (TPR) repeat protein
MWYKNLLILVLALFGVLCSYAQTRSINSIAYEKVDAKWYQLYNGYQYEVDESVVTVKFVSGINGNQKVTVAQNNNCTILRSNSLGYYDLQITTNRAAVDVVEDLLSDTYIDFAEPNTVGEFVAHSNDTYYWDQWHLQDETLTGGIDAYKAWNKENGDPDVVIGILDSGTDILHEDLKGNIWVNPGEDIDGDGVVWDSDDMNGIDDDGNGLIDDLSGWDFNNNNNELPGPFYHGTHVAGIAGAETNDAEGVAGVAGGWNAADKGCNMLIGGVGDNSPVGSVLDDAILYAKNEGAKVITMSLSVGFSQAIVDAINDAYSNGVFVNNASGNDYSGSLPFPANVGNCFAVGASNQNKLREPFSNYGPGLMVVAPGVDIKSTRKDNTYETGGGTSYASPQVAGTAGLIASRHPDFTSQDIEEVICLTAEKLSSYTFTDGYEYGSWNNEVGYGKLNADRAIGIKEDITSNTTLEKGNYVRDEVHVSNSSTLTLAAGSKFYLLKTGQLIVDAGATLIIEDNVTISGNNSNQIIVNGNIQLGQNVIFNKHGSTGFFTGLLLNNSNMQTNIDNVTFNEAYLTNYGAELEIINSNFNDCRWVFSHNGDITIDNCTFNETWLYLENMQNDPDMLARIYNSTFNNINVVVGLDMHYYHDYLIENNNIRAKYNGVQIYNCGIDNFTTQQFLNNTIHDCNWAGILAYNTNGSFAKNHIYDNKVGIKLFNKCNFSFLGNPSASNNMETNFITDNDTYEVYISKYGFPWYFRYNSIIDEDNGGNPEDPLIYFAYPAGGKVNLKDIRYNCWGSNFLDSEDLYPHTYFSWNPTWCPGSGFGEIDIAEQMYTDANTQIELQQYSEAKIIFKQLVDLYPESEYAVSAMKEMLRLEKFVTNDYNSLKEYYITDNTIQTDTILRELGASLANDCNIKLENWPDAIEYYESTISESPTLEDSVFAIIDLGYTYFLMENAGDKSAYVGKLAQFKPESKEKFFDHRDYLLSLLPVDNISEAMKGNIASLSEGELLQNVPNPFRESTQIWYKLESEATVQLNIFNYTGQLVSTINEGTRPEGIHQIDFNVEGLPNGIYFYSISINGQTTDSKKMTIMK